MTSLKLVMVVLCLAGVLNAGFALDGLDIAAFNVQTFGKGTMRKPDVVDVLVKIINRYDVILLQEIRDLSGQAIEQLLEEVNEDADDPYDYIISSRVGHTTSKEQYAFLYRSDEVEVIDSYEYDDGDESIGVDLFEREPFIVRFHCDETLVKDFVIVGIHTKPANAVNEIDRLVDVYDDIVDRWEIDEVLFAGDMNADCNYVPASSWPTIRLRSDDRFEWLIDDGVDTTTGSTDCAYDRFVTAGDELDNGIREGSVKVFDYDEAYNLSDDLMDDVSDHFPIELELLPDPKYPNDEL
ncbi:deoxyribonuclease-1-like [Antedon mediterranea]|uniref:deoxyribonuclease-1-like n=1 Tax=Antedon mediterranea TaxID=105859 RepID=UPI003AF7E6DC